VLLYGSETWAIQNTEEKIILEFEEWCYRRMLKISWIEQITNNEVFQKAKETKSLLKTLKNWRARMIGHSLWHNSFLTRISKKIVEGKNTIGRPPLS